MAAMCPDPACIGQDNAQSWSLGLCAGSEWSLQPQKEAEATHLNYFSCCSDKYILNLLCLKLFELFLSKDLACFPQMV